ncbi:MAG TPA: pyridoxamine 5'-phosphate oxidase [Nevskiaceae bacterium]|nr:pyridoxamine 5'-phosphate oxidase [Nevskiaceae bacterium]
MSQYTRNPPLDPDQLLPDPMAQLARWIDDARAAGMIEPGAMALATASADGAPSARMVLFKGFSEGCPRFFTHYGSRKGLELRDNPRAALLFWWDQLERQLRLEGRIERLSREESEAYFHSRPRLSQIGAATSRQSQVVASRAELDQRLADNEARYADGSAIPLPEDWGGFRLRPEQVECWQGRGGRLHDRLRYRRDGAGWVIERLEP